MSTLLMVVADELRKQRVIGEDKPKSVMSLIPASLTTLLISLFQIYFSMTQYTTHHDENRLY